MIEGMTNDRQTVTLRGRFVAAFRSDCLKVWDTTARVPPNLASFGVFSGPICLIRLSVQSAVSSGVLITRNAGRRRDRFLKRVVLGNNKRRMQPQRVTE